MLELSLEGWGAVGQVVKGIFQPDLAGVVGCEEWWDVRLEDWARAGPWKAR